MFDSLGTDPTADFFYPYRYTPDHFFKFSRELQDFCGFNRLPHASLTAMMTIFDTSGIEAYVTENNPKFANKIIKQLKVFKKSHQLDVAYDPYKAAYGSMPTHAKSNPKIKQLFINGHFCYVYRFGLITNGISIVRDITFYDPNFLADHPDISVKKNSDSRDKDKSLHDNKALIPVNTDFFKKHPLIVRKLFIGDAAFDSSTIYQTLLGELKFEKAFSPLNQRGNLSYPV